MGGQGSNRCRRIAGAGGGGRSWIGKGSRLREQPCCAPAQATPGQEPARLSTPIAEDFAAIRARLLAIRAAERSWVSAPEEARHVQTAPAAGPADFYGWLMGGGLWGMG